MIIDTLETVAREGARRMVPNGSWTARTNGRAAAKPDRLAILRQLAADSGVCACDFTDCCDVAQPTVSHHLKVLRDAGWVRTERRASNIYYFLEPVAVERFRTIGGGFTPSLRLPSLRGLPVIQPQA